MVSSPDVVEVPPPLLRWWRCLHHLPGGEGQNRKRVTGIPPGSKYIYVMEVKVVCDWKCAKKKLKLHVVSSFLVPLRKSGTRKKVCISPFVVINH